jgi:hypothetical protein
MKIISIVSLFLALLFLLVSCVKAPSVVKTYEVTALDAYTQEELSDKRIYKEFKEMSDGTWECDGRSYKYKLEVTGRLNNAVKDTTYIILSNIKEISFDRAWKASGLSSNSNDYFSLDEAVFVGTVFH